jgi:hypothetical protein
VKDSGQSVGLGVNGSRLSTIPFLRTKGPNLENGDPTVHRWTGVSTDPETSKTAGGGLLTLTLLRVRHDQVGGNRL